MARIVLKKDDLRPHVVATLTDATGSVVDLSTAVSVRFIMRAPGETTAKVDSTGSVLTAVSGEVGYAWALGDTNTAGVFQAEFEVNWGGSVYQTFPAEDYIEVEIVSDLGGAV